MIRLALDGQGGDHAPEAVVEGAVAAAKLADGAFTIILTGDETRMKAMVAGLGYSGPGIEFFHAPAQVGMDESPSTVLKTKQDSSLVACVALQKAGKADASISAGNSGAMMAASLMLLGRVGSIPRPAIGCVMPSLGKKTLVLDCGANVDEKPQTLVQFGVCGSVYAEEVMGRSQPKVGLLNVGEEEKKGPEDLQEAHRLLKAAPINFVGNVEGRDILRGEVDVIVTPGYTGNVILKLMEGFFEYHKAIFGEMESPAGKQFLQDWDYSNFGAALLLGLNGKGLITHGRADAKAIRNALHTAYELANSDVTAKIASKISQVV
jgi:glycerol-3-phosphate acyltransferase PlsX